MKTYKQKKVFLFVDGTNLYGGQYELFGNDLYLHFSTFISHIEKSLKREFGKIYFYASYSPQPKKPSQKQKNYLKNEALFYRSVKEAKRVEFFKGYRSPTSGKEKEVDVKLTADLVHMAHTGDYDEVFLMTGDADFLQALLIIHSITKKVNILCLENTIMYKGIYRFPTYIIRLSEKDGRYRKTSLVSEIFLDKEEVCKKLI